MTKESTYTDAEARAYYDETIPVLPYPPHTWTPEQRKQAEGDELAFELRALKASMDALFADEQ